MTGMYGENRLFGRRQIFTDAEFIDASNVVAVLDDTVGVYGANRVEIEYLYNYLKGDQPILYRQKDIRPEICNRTVINIANEIVSFKTGYLMGEPVQYVNRSDEETNTDALNALNDYMFAEDKSTKDKELAEWFHTCGVAYRMAIPNKRYKKDSVEDESPFCIYTLDPRDTFVIKRNDLAKTPIAGVVRTVLKSGDEIYTVYTDKECITVKNLKEIISVKSHGCGYVPIVEYPANTPMLGAFEIVLGITDAINNLSSNRLDAIEQFVQSLMVIKGADISSEEFMALKELGGIKIPENGDVKYLVQELSQTHSQTLKDDMYETILTITGMPNRNGRSSTSDTGAAVELRDGWSAAEARAKESEQMFKRAEKRFLKIILHILSRVTDDMPIKLSSIDIRFTRRNYENILSKSQVLTTMLSNDKIAPELAFSHCGLFVDPELAYTVSKQYAEEQEEKNKPDTPTNGAFPFNGAEENADENNEETDRREGN